MNTKLERRIHQYIVWSWSWKVSVSWVAIVLFIYGVALIVTKHNAGWVPAVSSLLLARAVYRECRGKPKIIPEQYHVSS